jgi:anti-sigma factor RsiW
LIAWLDGELPLEEAAVVEQHVAGCAACRAHVSAYRRVSADLAAYFGTAPEPAARPAGRTWLPVAAVAAVAAAIGIVVWIAATHERIEMTSNASRPVVAVPEHVGAVRLDAPAAPHGVSASVSPHGVAKTKPMRSQEVVRPVDRAQASEPEIEILVPADAVFPPGAMPPGIQFRANISVSGDGLTAGPWLLR